MIPNPCDSVMASHLRFKGELVVDQSVAGAFTSHLLDLNSPNATSVRLATIQMVELAESRLADIQSILAQLRKKVNKKEIMPADAEPEVAALEKEALQLQQTVRNLMARA
jgi:hypothetical protein